jgi:hypothetical protein
MDYCDCPEEHSGCMQEKGNGGTEIDVGRKDTDTGDMTMNSTISLAIAAALSLAGAAQAATLQNTSFESGLTGWTAIGTVSAVNSLTVDGISVTPKDGIAMAELTTVGLPEFLSQGATTPLSGGATLWYRLVTTDFGGGLLNTGDSLGLAYSDASGLHTITGLNSKSLTNIGGTGDSGWLSFKLPSGTTGLGFVLAGDFDNKNSHAFVDISAPVPEPGDWAMILAGLGMVGVMARRRSLTG